MMLFQSKQTVDYIVVGLGNPGAKYHGTRHNIGFAALDYIAQQTATPIVKSKFSGLYGTWQCGTQKVLLLKPQTFMNLSGQSVQAAANFYKVPAENIIVIYDDVSLDVGKLRIRYKGSAGGHNGIKSIIGHMGQDFPRIKIGVGEKPHPDYDLADWVLGKFSSSENKLLQTRFEDILQAITLIAKEDRQQAMNLYNK